MSSKRKASVPSGAAGKRRVIEEPEPEGGNDILDALGAGFGDNENDEDALLSAQDVAGLGDDLGAELEGELAGDENQDFGDEFGEANTDDEDDEGEEDFAATDSEAAVEESECDEDLELPLPETDLQTASEIDLSRLNVSAGQARRIAPLLCANSALKIIKMPGHDLNIAELREEEELEWDSEEFHDVEAIIIAEFLKANTELTRLDLARNSISDAGACALAIALRENATLEYLNLESNIVAEKGGKALCSAVSANSTISYLNVMYNAIPSSGQSELRELWTAAHQGSQLGLHL